MAHILLPPGYATDQSGTTFGIVSHRNATFLSHALRNKLNCNEREMAEVARPYEWNDRKSNHKAVF